MPKIMSGAQSRRHEWIRRNLWLSRRSASLKEGRRRTALTGSTNCLESHASERAADQRAQCACVCFGSPLHVAAHLGLLSCTDENLPHLGLAAHLGLQILIRGQSLSTRKYGSLFWSGGQNACRGGGLFVVLLMGNFAHIPGYWNLKNATGGLPA